ncbi:MAG: recombinase family protein [Patescibacteria group bacterium]
MRKAIILARVSTKEQEEMGHSLPAQIRRLKEYALKNNFKIDKEFSFSESAGHKIRRKFEEVLDYLKKNKDVRVLLCQNVDRATRNFRDAVDIDELRRNDGLEIHFVQEGFYINAEATGNQMFMWEAKVFLAKQYLNRLSDDVKRSIEQKIRNGEWPEKAPIGYLNADINERKEVVIDKNRGYLVKKAFELYSTGNYGLKQIVQILKDEGLRNSTKAGKPVIKSQLDQILKNPFYYGVMLYNGKLHPHRYEPLIEKWLFEKCKAVREGKSHTVIKYASKPFAFRGLVKCDHCDCMVGKDPTKGINYCICNQYKGKCGAERVTEEELLSQVRKAFVGLVMPDDVVEELKTEMEKTFYSERDVYKSSIRQFRKEFDEIDGMVQKAYLDNLKGRITDGQYDKIFLELKDRQEFLNGKMSNHTTADKEFLITSFYIIELAKRAVELFDSCELDEKRQLINFVLSNLRLRGKKLLWNYKKPFDAMALCSKNVNWLPELDSNQ